VQNKASIFTYRQLQAHGWQEHDSKAYHSGQNCVLMYKNQATGPCESKMYQIFQKVFVVTALGVV